MSDLYSEMGMLSVNLKEVADYFNANWQDYRAFVAQNSLYHQEMFNLLNQFLHDHMHNSSFSFVDVGCGDGSSVESVLPEHDINKYIGIDFAEDVLAMAPANLAHLNCEKEYILAEMTTAMRRLQSPVDIIFSSYSVHHLSYQNKFDFIHQCKNKLKPGGFFIMIDGILGENQTRDQWLSGFEEYYKQLYPGITAEELNQCMRHSRSSDYPEHISTFDRISHRQEWRNFQVLNQIGLIVFMVYSK